MKRSELAKYGALRSYKHDDGAVSGAFYLRLEAWERYQADESFVLDLHGALHEAGVRMGVEQVFVQFGRDLVGIAFCGTCEGGVLNVSRVKVH